jgi:hypothetical protein
MRDVLYVDSERDLALKVFNALKTIVILAGDQIRALNRDMAGRYRRYRTPTKSFGIWGAARRDGIPPRHPAVGI